jgi:DNA-nicking Smr family endonuclease
MARRKRKKKDWKSSSETSPPEIPSFVQLVVETPVAKLDLHGMTAQQAEARLRDFLRTQSRLSEGKVVHIVTGRGTRSEGAPVLPGVVQDMLAGELRELVMEVAGLPGGGALAVRLA